MARATIVAEPNGAGKTSFARSYLANDMTGIEFLNADMLADDLRQESRDNFEVEAGRLLLRRLSEIVARGGDFVIETTLANRTYAAKIANWKRRGYHVSLIYLRLASVESSIERVRRRMDPRRGAGHALRAPFRR